jgi:hypothetical protein
MQKSLSKTALVGACALACMFLTQCASLLVRDSRDAFLVTSNQRLLLRVQPLDSAAQAELTRDGVDPAGFVTALETELQYRLLQRNQEEAKDSAGANVILTVTVKHAQPGSGSAGAFSVLSLRDTRGSHTRQVDWTWRASSKENVAEGFRLQYFSRALADEIFSHIQRQPPFTTPGQMMLMN